MCHNLVRTQTEVGKLAERRLQSADELVLQLAVQFVAGIFLLHIAAHIRVEQKRVRNAVRIYAGAADGNVHVQTDLVIDHTERNGVRRAEFIVDEFLRIKIIYALIFAGIAAIRKTLANLRKGVFNARTERAGENRRLARSVIGEFTRLRAKLHHSALLHDHHALAVCHRNAGAARDDVVTAARIGGTPARALYTLCDKHLFRHRFAIEKFFPLIRHNTARGADSCLNKTHK